MQNLTEALVYIYIDKSTENDLAFITKYVSLLIVAAHPRDTSSYQI